MLCRQVQEGQERAQSVKKTTMAAINLALLSQTNKLSVTIRKGRNEGVGDDQN